jgi:mono/diheme cytochrome c family protein
MPKIPKVPHHVEFAVKTYLPLVASAAIVLLAASSTASAQGSANAGKRLAQQWCSSCHQVEPSAPAKDIAPPFASLGVEKGKDPGWVRAWLANPHSPMQGISLSRQQIDDIVAYLQSLSRAQ